MQVGADIRLLTSNSLQVDESSLTGESEPIDKNADLEITDEVPLGDQLNMVFLEQISLTEQPKELS